MKLVMSVCLSVPKSVTFDLTLMKYLLAYIPRFEVLIAVTVKIAVFLDVLTQCQVPEKCNLY